MKKSFLIALALAFFMLLTRGSHVLTQFSLPDASLALFLLAGMWLGTNVKSRIAWFTGFFVLASFIDFGAAAFDPAQGFCLTDGYWGLIPSYGVMWFGGVWLANRHDAFDLMPYGLVSLATTLIAFVISTQTYYLFSGRFPAQGLVESMQHGWEYLPSWMGFSAMYFAIIWLAVKALRYVQAVQMTKA